MKVQSVSTVTIATVLASIFASACTSTITSASPMAQPETPSPEITAPLTTAKVVERYSLLRERIVEAATEYLSFDPGTRKRSQWGSTPIEEQRAAIAEILDVFIPGPLMYPQIVNAHRTLYWPDICPRELLMFTSAALVGARMESAYDRLICSNATTPACGVFQFKPLLRDNFGVDTRLETQIRGGFFHWGDLYVRRVRDSVISKLAEGDEEQALLKATWGMLTLNYLGEGSVYQKYKGQMPSDAVADSVGHVAKVTQTYKILTDLLIDPEDKTRTLVASLQGGG